MVLGPLGVGPELTNARMAHRQSMAASPARGEHLRRSVSVDIARIAPSGSVVARFAGLAVPRYMWGTMGVLVLVGCTASLNSGVLGWTAAVYQQRGSARLSIVGMLTIVALAEATLRIAVERPRELAVAPGVTAWLVWLTALFVLVIGQGVYLGHLQHAGGYVVEAAPAMLLVMVPWLVFVVVRTRQDLLCIERWILLLGVFQATVGIANVVFGTGYDVGGQVLANYAGGPLLIILSAFFIALGRATRGKDGRRLALIVIAVTMVSIVLSQRRSFDLATGLFGVGFIMVALVKRPGFLLIAGTVLTLAVSGFVIEGGSLVALSSGGSANYAAVHGQIGDQYRNSERANVLAALAANPLGGLGFGVPWVQTKPLPGYFTGNFNYTHIGFLWFWMKMGLLGMIGYVCFLISGIAMSVRAAIGDREAPALVVVAGLTLGADIILEFTATFTGSDPQYTWFLALMFGIAAAALRMRRGSVAGATDRVRRVRGASGA